MKTIIKTARYNFEAWQLVALLIREAESTPIEVLRSQLAMMEPRADFDAALFDALHNGWIKLGPEPGNVTI